jgi:hypothetical protein
MSTIDEMRSPLQERDQAATVRGVRDVEAHALTVRELLGVRHRLASTVVDLHDFDRPGARLTMAKWATHLPRSLEGGARTAGQAGRRVLHRRQLQYARSDDRHRH